MKLLLTADLHFRTDWFRWLIGQAPNYGLVCIAGDLLDMFDNKSPREQAREVGKINLDGSRFNNSQANRAAVDGASSCAAHDWLRR
jgi:Icc-related predicted phosphoesterase